MPLTHKELVKELDRRDLYELIQTYEHRRLARAIVASPKRAELVEAIRLLAMQVG